MHRSPRVIVVGGGIAGLAAALNISQRGAHVSLVEREAVLGGRALNVCCKAIDGVCQTCGGCLLADRLAAVKSSDRIDVYTLTSIIRLQRENGGFVLQCSGSHDKDLQADAVILATGFDHIDAHTKGPYGFGVVPAVTTGEEMERRFREQGQAAYDGMGLHKVAFIQCVGSRDEHVGRGYCSQVCCRYALRLARVLKSRLPDLEITILKMDIQTAGRDFAATWQAVEVGGGIRIVAGLPAVIRRSSEDPRQASFIYDDVVAGELSCEAYDLVVLSTGIQPRRDAEDVAEMYGINRGPYGFFAARDDETSTLAPGVFVAGCCQAPRAMAESVAHAQQAAEACARYLQEKAL